MSVKIPKYNLKANKEMKKCKNLSKAKTVFKRCEIILRAFFYFLLSQLGHVLTNKKIRQK
jgi:hypothetical protein